MYLRPASPVRPIYVPLFAVLLGSGCGLRVTNDRVPIEYLELEEKDAVDIMLDELVAFNEQIKSRTRFDIDVVAQRERIDVDFQGLIVAANIGDDVIHVSTWENLSDAQRELVQSWFESETPEQAKHIYSKFFYEFLTVGQGVKQYMYEVLSTEWVYENRSLFNVERDSARVTLSHYRESGRKAEMWSFARQACSPLLAKLDATYHDKFNRSYFMANVRNLVDNFVAPTGYMYFICRWLEQGMEDSVNLTAEFNWLSSLPELAAQRRKQQEQQGG